MKAGPIPKDALQFFRAKVSTQGFDYRDVWRQEHAAAFTVAKAMRVDVLEGIRSALDDALAQGKTFAQFKKELSPTLQKMGWWGKKKMIDPLTGEPVLAQLGSNRRLKTIFRANMRTARAAGQWQRAERTKKALPYLLYELGPSREHRDEHVGWHGTLLSIDDPWWDTHMPPNGYGCKCRVRQVSRGEHARMAKEGVPSPDRVQVLDPASGLPTGQLEKRQVPVKTQAPKVTMVRWENKRTGRAEMVPEGIQPGWDTNPGKVRQQNLELMLAQKLNAASKPVLSAAVADLAASGRFAGWVDDVVASGQATGQIQIVGAVDERTRAFLSGKGVTLETSVIDINDVGILHAVRDAKAARGAALRIEDLRDLPLRLLTTERYWDSQDPALVYAFDTEDADGRRGKAVVRVNYRAKGKITNRVVTTGVVQPGNLEDPRYERIGGKN
jgi:hypothetical protein